jgi:tRNA/tmRNA/rRNA uracil-C5-methylase (TrmA/RlmC/RlmD family)
VIAVEIDRAAVALLRRAAQRAHLPLTAIAGDVGEVRGQLGAKPDVVVVNPPRKGLSAGARGFLTELAAPMILYVSCGPDALGRDLVALGGHGYTPDVIEPFDLMPGTAQVETIVRLRSPGRVVRHGQRSM